MILLLFQFDFAFGQAPKTKSQSTMTESQRFLKLSCSKNNAQACLLLGRIWAEEKPKISKDLLQKACDLGKCESNFKKNIIFKDPNPQIAEEKEYLKGGFEVDIIRKIASVEKCVDLPSALGNCRSYRCREPHPLVAEHYVVHSVLRRKNFCYYTQQLPKNQLIQCRLTDDQAREFESLSQLSAFSKFESLLEQKVCILRPIHKNEL
tara:strand:- start:3080 stop:3700 length:621 start_codon:yes stop_codon:yes gene_type:complete